MANSQFSSLHAVMAGEYQHSTQWKDTVSNSHPLLSIILGKSDVPNDFYTTDKAGGGVLSAVPVILTASSPEGITTTDSYTPKTPVQLTNADGDQATYNFSTYRDEITFNHRELNILKNGAVTNRGLNPFDLHFNRMMIGFRNKISTELWTGQADGEDKIMGVPHAVSGSNTVGGLSQTALSNWQSVTRPAVGTLTTAIMSELVEDGSHHDSALGLRSPDVICMSERPGARLYSKLKSLLGSQNYVLVGEGHKDYGFKKAFMYDDAWIVSCSGAPHGEIFALNSDSFYFDGTRGPVRFNANPAIAPGGSTESYTWHWDLAFGCRSPRENVLYRGVTTS